jgi:uncharacterized membrane protein YbhN (UPF0104 family)
VPGSVWGKSGDFMRSVLIAVLQVLVTLALLGWIFSDAVVREGVMLALRESDGGWMLLAVLMAGLCVGAGILRWFIFLRMQNFELGLRRVAAMFLLGGFFNLFLFGSLGGDAAKVVCVCRESPGRHTAAILSVLMDHMSGFVALLGLAICFTFVRYDVFMQTPLAAGMLGTLILVLGISLGGVVLSLMLVRWQIGRRLPLPAFWRKRMAEVGLAFAALSQQWRKSLLAVAVSVVVMLSHFFTFYCASRAVGGRSSLLDILTVMPVVDVMAGLPVSISGLGVREKSFEELLGVIGGVPAETAVLISLGGFAATMVWGLVGGIVFCLYRSSGRRIHFSDVRSELPHLESKHD